MKTKRKFLKCERSYTGQGFTLVEVMIVVAIIGILAAIAVPSFMRSRARSNINRVKSDLRVISGAINELAFDTGRWPGGYIIGAGAGDAEIGDLNSGSAGIIASDGSYPSWYGPYMKLVPKDPWNSDYFFDPDYDVGGDTYSVVGSFGPNKSAMNDYDEDNIYVVLE